MTDVANKKKRFACWLAMKHETQFKIDALIWNIDSIRVCYSKIIEKPINIWDFTKPAELEPVIQTISKNLPDSFPIHVSPEPLGVFKDYLSEMNQRKKKPSYGWKTKSVYDKTEDYQSKLEGSTLYLLRKYFNCPACFWDQLRTETSEINFDYYNDWTHLLYNIDAVEFLSRYGIIEKMNDVSFHQRVEIMNERHQTTRPQKTRTTHTTRNRGLNTTPVKPTTIPPRSAEKRTSQVIKLEPIKPLSQEFVDAMRIIKSKYRIEPAKSLIQIEQENPKITVDKLNRWAKEFYGMSAKNYLTLEKLMERKDKSWRSLDTISRQPAWNKRETVLLIHSCNKVLIEGKDKKTVTKKLSVELRRLAIRDKKDIDSNYRDEVEISIQMTKMMYLLTDGAQGMPGACPLFCDMVEFMRNQPNQFNMLLCEALD